MKNASLPFALILAMIAFQACQNKEKTSDDTGALTYAMEDSTGMTMNGNTGVDDNDTAKFMNEAAIGGKMEVELGKMAQQQGSNVQVKEFGAMMDKDHSKANAELKSIADAQNIMLDDTYPADVQAHINDMKMMKGSDFDHHYMKMMVEDHVKDISLFQSAAKHPNASISSFATKTLPVLEMHHKKAVEINESLPK